MLQEKQTKSNDLWILFLIVATIQTRQEEDKERQEDNEKKNVLKKKCNYFKAAQYGEMP